MLRSLVFLGAIALGPAAFAQDEATVDPNVATPSIQEVVGQCEIVASYTEGAASVSGICLSATGAFLAGLEGSAPAVIDQSVTDLVVALVPLVQDEVCNQADEEIAQAIRLASTKASDPEQVAALLEIADTVQACEATETAVVSGELEVSPG